MPDFLPGVELARAFYTDAVRPLLGDLRHAAGRLGPGSDVLGYDTARSTDHDWGPRLELFVDDPGDLHRTLAMRLPKRVRGWPTHFVPAGARVRGMADTDGPVDHYVTITPLGPWLRGLLGFDPRDGVTRLDWLATPWQRLAEVTGGAVFHDPAGELTAVRRRLTRYPDNLWRHVLAAQWQRIAEEEAFVGRTAENGDDAGSRMVTARLCREVGRLLLLLARRWPPYGKWLMHALGDDPVGPHLRSAMRAADGHGREAALCTAYEIAAARQNALGLSAALPATRRPFFDRPYAVIDGGRFAEALRAAITDPTLRRMSLSGSVDQVVDSTDVLGSPSRCRAVMTAVIAAQVKGEGGR